MQMRSLVFALIISAAASAGAQNTSTIPAANPDSSTVLEKVGNGVSAPALLYGPSAAYPKAARKAKIEGLVDVNCIVGIDGRVHYAKVMNDPGYGFAESALQTVKTYIFKPAMKDGKPVAVWVTVQVGFTLIKKSSD